MSYGFIQTRINAEPIPIDECQYGTNADLVFVLQENGYLVLHT